MTMTTLQVHVQYKGKKASRMNHGPGARDNSHGGQKPKIYSSSEDRPTDWHEVLFSDLESFHITRPKPEHIVIVKKSGQIRFSWTDVEKDGDSHRRLEKQIRDAMKPYNRLLREEADIKFFILAPSNDHDRRGGREDHRERDDRDRYERKYREHPDGMMSVKPRPSHALVSRGSASFSSNSAVALSSHLSPPIGSGRSSPSAVSTTWSSRSAPSVVSMEKTLGDSVISTRTSVDNFTSAAVSGDHFIPNPTPLTKFDLTLNGLKDLQRALERKDYELQTGQARSTSPRETHSAKDVPASIPVMGEFGQVLDTSPSLDIEIDQEREQEMHKNPTVSDMDADGLTLSTSVPPPIAAGGTTPEKTIDDMCDGFGQHSDPHLEVRSAPTPGQIHYLPQNPTTSSTQLVSELTRQLWDVRRQRTALVARENKLVDTLKALGSSDGETASDSQLLTQKIETLQRALTAKSEQLKMTQGKLDAVEASYIMSQKALHLGQQNLVHQVQKLGISRERNGVLKTALANCQEELGIEKERRGVLESVIEDLEKEMKAVPEVFEAMIKIAEVSCLAENAMSTVGSQDFQIAGG